MSSTTAVSLTQARELYNVIIACQAKLDSLDNKAKTATVSFADLYNVIQDVFLVLKEMGLPDDVARAIAVLQRMTMALHSAYIAMITLSAASGGTVPMILAGIGVITSLAAVVGSAG